MQLGILISTSSGGVHFSMCGVRCRWAECVRRGYAAASLRNHGVVCLETPHVVVLQVSILAHLEFQSCGTCRGWDMVRVLRLWRHSSSGL